MGEEGLGTDWHERGETRDRVGSHFRRLVVGEGKELWDEDLEGPRPIYLNIQLSWVIFAGLV